MENKRCVKTGERPLPAICRVMAIREHYFLLVGFDLRLTQLRMLKT